MWMFAAILTVCGTAMLTSCTDVNDNGVVPSADNPDTTGWIFDKNKDTSIKPGDDFYMHCNGTWWKNTELGSESIIGFLDTEVSGMASKLKGKNSEQFQQLINSHSLNPFSNAEKDGAKAQTAIDLLASATSKEELWVDMGKLKKQGFQMPYHIISLSKGGKMCLVFVPVVEFENADNMSKGQKSDEDNLDDLDDLLNMLRSPKLANALEPICQNGGTRSFNQEKWPMLVKICKGLGVDPTEAYILNDDFKDSIDDFQSILKLGTTADLEQIQALEQKDLASILTSYIEDDKLIFDKTYKESIEEKYTAKFKVEDVITNIGPKYLFYYFSYLFAKDIVTPEMKNHGLAYVDELVQSFGQRIKANSWLSEESKANAVDKLNAMTRNVGYPDTWITEGLPDLSSTQSLYEDVMEIRRAFMALTLKLTTMSVQEGSFHSLIAHFCMLQTINAFYAPNFNSMNILPIWLMNPLYDPAAGDAYNYATISVFGHEITHGFDTYGSKFNKIGDEGSIWASAADEKEFSRRAKMLSDYFSSIEVLPDVYGDGEKTVAENIADLGGVEIAFTAFTNHLKSQGISGEQMREQQRRFFYAFAHLWMAKYSEDHIYTALLSDNHSLYKERVNCTLANIDAWYDLFDVKPGDKYYISPEKRVHIW